MGRIHLERLQVKLHHGLIIVQCTSSHLNVLPLPPSGEANGGRVELTPPPTASYCNEVPLESPLHFLEKGGRNKREEGRRGRKGGRRSPLGGGATFAIDHHVATSAQHQCGLAMLARAGKATNILLPQNDVMDDLFLRNTIISKSYRT
jgi:hypothetical protein